MLVLARTPGSSVTIRDDIVIHVLECQSGKVKLGFSAPPDVKILRTEIVGKEKSNQKESA